ncbi:MAG: hypothetical protein NVS3B2_02420 [Ramlibacter sp.]
MSDEGTGGGTDADFRSALRRAGLTVDPERLEAMREAYEQFTDYLAVLDRPLGYTDEPASVLRLT